MGDTGADGALDWPDATVVHGDAVDVVARLKQESDVPLRSHGSLSLNRALMAAGLFRGCSPGSGALPAAVPPTFTGGPGSAGQEGAFSS